MFRMKYIIAVFAPQMSNRLCVNLIKKLISCHAVDPLSYIHKSKKFIKPYVFLLIRTYCA